MSSISEKTTIRKLDNFPVNISFLLIEDMDVIRIQLAQDLRSIGVMGKIHEAANLESASQICNTEKIEFIICDWNLPDGTGHDFLKKFRAITRYKTTPFVMCTTNSEIKFFLAAIASGANDYIVKPWKIEELKKKISLTWETWLSKH